MTVLVISIVFVMGMGSNCNMKLGTTVSILNKLLRFYCKKQRGNRTLREWNKHKNKPREKRKRKFLSMIYKTIVYMKLKLAK